MKQIAKSINKVEPQKLGLASIAGFLLVSLALFATSSYDYPSLPTSGLNKRAAVSIQTNDTVSLQKSKGKNETQERGILSVTKDENNSSISVGAPKQLHQDQNNPKQLEEKNETQERGIMFVIKDVKNSSVSVGPPKQLHHDQNSPEQLGGEEAKKSNQNLEPKIVCNLSDPRTDVCEIEGDIRINGNSSSVFFLPSSQTNTTQSWTIKPHPRKGDPYILTKVTKISIKPFSNTLPPQHCTINHSIPAVVFSTGGYMGNAFHDFTDILIPLFITSRQFNGEVQFLVAEIHPIWNIKYQLILKHLSHYDILNFNNDKEVHCYPRTIVGLRSHKEMTIDPSRSPYTMADFGRLVRSSFSLPREIAYSEPSILQSTSFTLKPRLLIIARRWSRSFKNVDEIVKMAEDLGFEVVVGEAGGDLAKFARLVNSCDVMMGVHGAGMTNLVFLPANAVLIQVVPLGRLEGISKSDFGVPAVDLGMKYLQYSISEEESTLVEMYPKDDPVFKDPVLIHRQGWNSVRNVYLVKQNVRLDVKRFKGTLLQALELLKF